MSKTIGILVVAVAFFATGCVTSWKVSEGGALGSEYRYGIKMGTPKDWYERRIHRMELFTRHGVALEYISINSWKWGDTLSSGRPLSHTIMLHQLPELALRELYNPVIAFNFVINSSKIVKINGFPCSLTEYSYTSPAAIAIKGILYCIPFTNFCTALHYEAEASNYFEKTIDEFKLVAGSIKINSKEYRYLSGISATKK